MARTAVSHDVWPPLPRKVRLRLWYRHQANAAGIWLADHGRYRAAERLWRLLRMW